MGTASLSFSVVNFVKATIGSGILGLPYAFSQTGLLLGISLIIFCGVVQALAVHFLAIFVIQEHKRAHGISFNSLAWSAFGGRKIASNLVSACELIGTAGTTTGYLIVIGDLAPEVCEYFGVATLPWISRSFWITSIGWCILLPISFPSNVDSLKVSSLIGIVGIAYTTVIICLFSFGLLDLPHPQQSVSFWPPHHSEFTSIPGMMQSCPIFIFAFACAINMPALVVELDALSLARADLMIFLSLGTCTAVYVLVGVCGSLAFGASVEGDALKSFPKGEGTIGGLLSTIGRIAIVANVMGGVPLKLHPLRAAVSPLVFGKESADLRSPARIALTIILFVFSWLLSLVITNLDEVMAFIGSTTNMICGFTLPALFFVYGVDGRDATNGNEEDFGIRSSEHVDRPLSFGSGSLRKAGLLRHSARAMAVVSFVLIPVLLSGETFKVTSHEH